MKAVIFDTETTGLTENRTIALDKQPHIIEFYACLVDLKNQQVLDEMDLLIRPPNMLSDKPDFGSKKTTTQITGISNEMLKGAPCFADVMAPIKVILETAPLIIAHNLTFDKDMVELELERHQNAIAWPFGICTVEQTVHLTGARLKLEDLHNLLFGMKFEAHRAKADTQALVRCCYELFKRGII